MYETSDAAIQGQASRPNEPIGVQQNGRAPKTRRTRPLAELARWLRDREWSAALMRRGFRALQRAGINVTPSHFYWPIPDMAELERRVWPERAVVPFDLRLEKQLDFLRASEAQYGSEWATFADQPNTTSEYHRNNGYFETIDAEIAYSFVRRFQPSRIIEIGTGYSTRVMAAGLRANLDRDGVRGELISIDPFPERVPKNGFSDLVTQIPGRVQEMDLEIFRSLKENDILFIDSSHVVSIGSDVVREYLEILPILQPGVLVHVHDIFLPSDYPRKCVLNNQWFWSEQYLLQAFLSFNNSFEVLWASSAMRTFHRQDLEEAFPRWSTSYRDMPKSTRRYLPTPDDERVWPSSFWMRRVA